jgi:hypothetical protein
VVEDEPKKINDEEAEVVEKAVEVPEANVE